MPSSGQASQVEYFSAILFRQHAASIYGFVCFVFLFHFVRQKKCLSKRPSSYCLIHFGGSSGAAQGQLGVGRRSLMEDDLRWKMTFDGRRPSMEDDLRWKTTFDRRRPKMEDILRWKTTDGGRLIMGEVSLQEFSQQELYVSLA